MPAVSRANLLRSICRTDYSFFFRTFWPVVVRRPLVWSWHIKWMCDEIQKVMEGLFDGRPKMYDVCDNRPPGTSKSSAYSIFLTGWAWTRMPECCVLGGSYAEDVAQDHSMKARDVVRSELYRTLFPEIQIRDDQDRKGRWQNTLGGVRQAVGVCSKDVIGRHFDAIVTDDPIDPMGTASKAKLGEVNYWIENVLGDRWKDKTTGVYMNVMQRLAMDDPAGRMVRRSDVRHFCLPATTEMGNVKPPELADNYVGGLLDPVRLPREYLDKRRDPKNLGDVGYSAQFLQSPKPLGGGTFKTDRLRWAAPPGEYVRMCRAWDKAVTPQKAGGLMTRQPDFTVGLLMALDKDGRVWVLDVRRGRFDSFAREALIKRTAVNDGRSVSIAVEVEPGSAGKDSYLATAKRLLGWKVRPMPSSGSKEARADDFSHAVNSGLVYLPKVMRPGDRDWAGWAKDLVDELAYFPFAPYDDQVDAASMAFTVVSRQKVRVGAV